MQLCDDEGIAPAVREMAGSAQINLLASSGNCLNSGDVALRLRPLSCTGPTPISSPKTVMALAEGIEMRKRVTYQVPAVGPVVELPDRYHAP